VRVCAYVCVCVWKVRAAKARSAIVPRGWKASSWREKIARGERACASVLALALAPAARIRVSRRGGSEPPSASIRAILYVRRE